MIFTATERQSEFNKFFPTLKKDRNKFFGYFCMNPKTYDYISEKKKLSEVGKSLCCHYPKPSANISIVMPFQV
jgi:hypothetical protein